MIAHHPMIDQISTKRDRIIWNKLCFHSPFVPIKERKVVRSKVFISTSPNEDIRREMPKQIKLIRNSCFRCICVKEIVCFKRTHITKREKTINHKQNYHIQNTHRIKSEYLFFILSIFLDQLLEDIPFD